MSTGRLPIGWAIARLESVVQILDSRRIPVNAAERETRQGSVPYYGATGQIGWIDKHLFDEELVLLGEDGAPFLDPARSKAYLIRGKAWVNNHAHVLRGVIGLSNAFIAHHLNAVDYHPFVSGTTRLKLPQAPMRRIPLRIAPTEEQTRIVEAIETQLTRLDAAVAALERVQANLKRYRASILKAAVEGRLVPTEAELARREGRDYEPASVLLQRILTERRHRWEEAELAAMKGKGRVPTDDRWKERYEEPLRPESSVIQQTPEGWCWTTLDSVSELQTGLAKGKARKRGQKLRSVPYLRVANVQRGWLDLSEVKTIEATEEESSQLRLCAGDVLFNESGDRDKLGRGWVWSGELPECIHQNHVHRARPVSTDVRSKFLSWYGNTHGQRYFLREGKQTTNLASVNMTKLKSLPMPLPPVSEQSRIETEVERSLSIISQDEQTVERALVRAASLRLSILKWAFEGQLVDQDPNDEPASVLLDRIRAEREAARQPTPPQRRPRRRVA